MKRNSVFKVRMFSERTVRNIYTCVPQTKKSIDNIQQEVKCLGKLDLHGEDIQIINEQTTLPESIRTPPCHALFFNKGEVRTKMERCCYISTGAAQSTLSRPARVQSPARDFVVDELFPMLQPLHHRRNLASRSQLDRYFYGMFFHELHSLFPPFKSFTTRIRHATYSGTNTPNSLRIPFVRKVLFGLAALWNRLPRGQLPSRYILQFLWQPLSALLVFIICTYVLIQTDLVILYIELLLGLKSIIENVVGKIKKKVLTNICKKSKAWLSAKGAQEICELRIGDVKTNISCRIFTESQNRDCT